MTKPTADQIRAYIDRSLVLHAKHPPTIQWDEGHEGGFRELKRFADGPQPEPRSEDEVETARNARMLSQRASPLVPRRWSKSMKPAGLSPTNRLLIPNTPSTSWPRIFSTKPSPTFAYATTRSWKRGRNFSR